MNHSEPNDQAFREWVAARPPHIRAGIKALPPWKLYRLSSSGHRVTIHSYDECACGGLEYHDDCCGGLSLTVSVTGRFNLVNFSRNVFGILPRELVECDLPEAGERLGETMSQEEARGFMAGLARPH